MLTIDIRLQEVLERLLESNIKRIAATMPAGKGQDIAGGSAVVIDVRTGEILALASYPTYHLEQFSQDYRALAADPLNPMFDRAISGLYAPGSVFKMVSAVAGLETGVITPKTRIVDRGIYTYYAPNYTPKCWIYTAQNRTHGSLDVVGAIKNSCNYFFYETGRLAGIGAIEDYGKQLGLGELSGIELAGEAKGQVAGPVERKAAGGLWFPGDTLGAAIGQSDHLFTPLQLVNYVATLVNGGIHYKPTLFKSAFSYNYDRTLHINRPVVLNELNLKPETAAAVKQGMGEVTENGTASAVFRDYEVHVGGKTGSVQVGGGRSDNGVFAAFAPYDEPEIAIVIVVEQGGTGGNIAPIARDFFEAYFAGRAADERIVLENTLLA